MLDRTRLREKLRKMSKQTDDWSNNEFVSSGAMRDVHQLLPALPQKFKNYRRDKEKDIDPGKAFLGRNKRKHDGRKLGNRKTYDKEDNKKIV